MYINVGKSLYTIIYVLLAIIAIMMLLSYFNIDLKADEHSNVKLTRKAVFEGYGKSTTNNSADLNVIMQN